MATLSPARRAALAALSERRRRDARMRDLLRGSRELSLLDERDRALAFLLALGAVATEGLLDEVLARYVRRPSELEPRVHDALRLATFEALYLETRPSAVVSQGVELVRSVAPRATGLANAVLRKVVTVRAEVAAARQECATAAPRLDALRLASGLPGWLLERVIEERDIATARALALSQLEGVPTYVATNFVRHDAIACERVLRNLGTNPTPMPLPGSFSLGNSAALTRSQIVASADVVVADFAAQMVARIAAPRPTQRVLEVGQGRGTKSILLESAAMRSGGYVRISGVDVEPYKVEVARQRMVAAGLAEHVTSVVFDATKLADDELPEAISGPFGLVFVDAPCTGAGTLRRHPEIAWSLTPSSLVGENSLPALQRRMLEAAATHVAHAGTLVYATCSLFAEENEQVVEGFLASELGSGFTLERADETFGTHSLPADALELVRSCVDERGYFQSAPAPGSFDGHFCAVMRRG